MVQRALLVSLAVLLGTAGASAAPHTAEELLRDMALASPGMEISRSPLTGLVTFVAAAPGQTLSKAAIEGSSAAARATTFATANGALFGFSPETELRVTTEKSDEIGLTHVRLQQLHGGVAVTAGEIVVHLKGEHAASVTARTLSVPTAFDVDPALDPAAAAKITVDTLRKLGGMEWVLTGVPRLEVFNEGLLDGRRHPTRLAWFVEASHAHRREFVWIDAETGALLLRFAQAPSALSRRVHTAGNSPSIPGTLVRTEGGPATGDADVDLAYLYSGDTYNYFATQHGRDSFDGAGGAVISTVRYCRSGEPCPWANAFWNGTQMIFGQGHSVDDVVAHEFAHGVTEWTAGLFYYMQSGALNESFSDIFGETVDQSNASGNDSAGARWFVAEDIANSGPWRHMMDPTLFGDPGKMSDPQFFCGDYNEDNGGVHFNSGVPNHAYALMVDGGAYNGYAVAGIGAFKAGQVQYRALNYYLISGSDFLDAYYALRQSCADLVGTAGITAADCGEVGKALEAVQLAQPWPCGSAQAVIPSECSEGQSATYSLHDNFEAGFGGWSTSVTAGSNLWSGASHFAASGLRHLFGRDDGVAADGVPDDSSVRMVGGVVVPAGGRLQFNHAYGFESGSVTYYDGGVIEYSVNGGATWADAGGLITSGATYGGVISTTFSNPLGGRAAFVGDSYGYTASQLDLANLVGQTVWFRFRIGTDSCCGDYGWAVDDVRLYTCLAQVPAASVDDVTVVEGHAGRVNASFTVRLSAAVSETRTIEYSTAPGTASAGADYDSTSGVLTFAPFTTTATVVVPVVGDVVDEPNEAFSVLLSNPSAGMTIADGNGVGTIADDDPKPSLSVDDLVVAEGDSGWVNGAFTVSLTGASSDPVTVNYSMTGGSAAPGSDYLGSSGTLTFPSGGAGISVAFVVLGDLQDEPNEQFFLNLSGVSGNALIADAQGSVTITDNDPTPLVSVDDVTVTEGGSGTTNAVFTVRLTGLTGDPVTVSYATVSGSAVQGSDFSGTSGTLNFSPGVASLTVPVAVIGDIDVEADETFFLMLSNVSPNAILSDGQGAGTITDDDPNADISVTKTNGLESVVPGQSVTYTITVSNAGPNAAPGTLVSDAVPSGLTGAVWTCTASAGATCGSAGGSGSISETVDLASGSSVVFSLAATVAQNPTTVRNTATAAAPGDFGEPNPLNNSATDDDLLVCAPYRGVVADGQSSSAELAIGETAWYIALLRSGSSYSLESRAAAGAAELTVYRGDDGCSGATTAVVRDTGPVDPRSADLVRRSFTATGTDSRYRFRVVNGTGAPLAFSFHLEETSLFSAAWTTNSAYETYYSFQNTTTEPITGLLTLRGTSGAVAGTATVVIPPGRTSVTNTLSMGAVRNRTGTAEFSHDGPPRAVLVQAAIANFAATPGYVQPVKFTSPRADR